MSSELNCSRRGRLPLVPHQIRIAVRCRDWRGSAVNDTMPNPIFYSIDA